MLELIARHGKVYSRDKVALLMSFLSVIILIVIYQVFLGQLQMDTIKQVLQVETVPSDTIKMVNLWLISGLTTIVSMTSTLGALGVMVADKERKVTEDFHVSPLSPLKLDLSYTIFAILFGILLTTFSCLFAIVFFNGFDSLAHYSLLDLSRLLGLISLGAILSATMVLPILSFINTSSAFTTLSTIIGTFIGFISGVYLSIGSVGDLLKTVMTWFPLTQVNALMKQTLMKDSISAVFDKAPAQVVTAYRQNYGIDLLDNKGGLLTTDFMLGYIIALIFLLFGVNYIIKKMKK